MQNQIPYISNRDAQLLHRIVNLAEDDPDVGRRPKSALFGSYDKVFTEQGLNTNNDRTCFKLVTRIAGDNFAGLGLRERLDIVLKEAGIVLDYDDHGDDLSVAEEEEIIQEEDVIDDPADAYNSHRRPARRNSFTSIYDLTLDSRPPPRRTSLSPSMIPNRDLISQRDLPPFEAQAIQFDRRALLSQSFRNWMNLSGDRREDDRLQRAELAYETKLKAKAFQHWLSVALDKRADADQSREEWIQLKYFKRWVEIVHLHMEREAKYFSEMRIKRNVLSKWREEFRSTGPKDRIDGRLKAQSVYKWVIACRVAKFERQRDLRLKQETLQTLSLALETQRHRAEEHEAQADAHRRKRLVLFAVQRLGSATKSHETQETKAIELHDVKVQRNVLLPWREKREAVHSLELKADDAIYYFTMTKMLQRWRLVANEAKRRRLNKAYKETRQAGKTNVLKRALTTWRGRVRQIQAMQEQIEAREEQRNRALVQNSFVKWQIGTSERQQQEQQAKAHYDETLHRKYFNKTLDAARRIHALESVADRFHSVHESANLSIQLRRVSMRGFEIKRREEDADAMRYRHSANHTRNMLRHWAAKAKHPPSPLSTETTGVPSGSAVQRSSVVRTALRELPGGTPGYLNTPSRRVVQMRALAIGNTPLLRFPMQTPRLPGGDG